MTSSAAHEHEPVPAAWKYRVPEDERRRRVSGLLHDTPPTTDKRFVCYQLGDPALEDVARTIERTVFERSFGNDADVMAKLYGPYEAASRFFLSVDQTTAEPVGVLRVIENSPAGLMTLNTLPPEASEKTTPEIMAQHDITSLDECWDIGTVAIPPEFRAEGRGISVQLYRAMYVTAMAEGIRHMVSIIDRKPHDTMTEYLGIPFEPLAESRPFSYEGSGESLAVHGFIPDFYPKMRRKSLTLKGMMARRALWPLVFGTHDDSLMLGRGEK